MYLDNIESLGKETVRQEQQIKTLFIAMERIEKKTDEALKIVTNIERLTMSVEALTKQMEILERKVSLSEAEPGTAWKNFKWILVGLFTSGIMGGIITALLTLINK